MDEDFKLCILAEVNYKKKHPDKTDEELFPMEWYTNYNYKLKADILLTAIMENKLIVEIPEFQQMIEGVKDK